jgi:PKD repeat protein
MGCNVYQFDLTAGTAADIAASQTLVGVSCDNVGDMQIGPDQKIYATINNGYYLSVINDPNNLGTACNFVDASLYLGGKQSGIGLPSTIVKAAGGNIQSINFGASVTELCEKFCVNFLDSSSNNPSGWLWLFAGGSPASSTDQNPTHICYQNPGTYDVTLITTNANGNDTLTLSNYITVYSTPPLPTITQNGYILTSSAADFYQWQFNNADIPGATNQSYTATLTGYYTILISDSNSCSSSATVYVLIVGLTIITPAKPFRFIRTLPMEISPSNYPATKVVILLASVCIIRSGKLFFRRKKK